MLYLSHIVLWCDVCYEFFASFCLFVMSYLCCFCYCVYWCHTRIEYISTMTGVFNEAGTAYHSRAPWFTSSICLGPSFKFWVLCCNFVFVCFLWLRLVCPVFPVSLDCTFMIAPSIFPNVNNLMNIKKKNWIIRRFRYE
jgi:hypothetical protein